MTNRKNQNSILFLATLGVYLGLFIAGGAAPQVFAHSATTRAFEITDEIEVKDDLDKNPDDVICDGAYDPVLTVSESVALTFSEAVLRVTNESILSDVAAYQSNVLNPSIENVLHNGNESIFGNACRDFRTSLKTITLQDDELNLTLRIESKVAAHPYALMTFFQSGIESKRPWTNNERIISILRHTSQFIENDQLYVVTRLPRAGLDTLLAKKVK